MLNVQIIFQGAKLLKILKSQKKFAQLLRHCLENQLLHRVGITTCRTADGHARGHGLGGLRSRPAIAPTRDFSGSAVLGPYPSHKGTRTRRARPAGSALLVPALAKALPNLLSKIRRPPRQPQPYPYEIGTLRRIASIRS